MKRFFKTGAACVLALALMSTSAFAAVTKEGSSVGFDENGKLDVTVAGTTTDEQVALMVLKGTKSTGDLANVKNTDIAYIDQKAGAANLAFSDINVGTENVVTVFAGSTKTGKAILLGTASLKAPELNASAKSFNVPAGVETAVDLTLTDQNKNTVTDATVTYKVKDSAGEFAAAGELVRYDGGWKFNFATAATYEVVFTKGTVSETVYVCVYDKRVPITGEGENAKMFVIKERQNTSNSSYKDVAAVVKVNLGETAQSGTGSLIWSIEVAGGVRHYTKAKPVEFAGLSGAVDMACGFTNDTGKEVTAVNVIYKNAKGDVFFTDEADKANESNNAE